jgi:voltage-gated potassium channel
MLKNTSWSYRWTDSVLGSFAGAVGTLLLVLVIGTVGYRIIGGEQYSWIDCFYMTFITIATIGYGEIIDLSHSPGGRLFTVALSVAGIGVSTYIMSKVVAYLVEGRINEVLWRRRMDKYMHKMKDHYILCGIGRVGRNVAAELAATGRPFIVVDENIANIRTGLERHSDAPYIVGDACDDDVLIHAHVETAAGVFAVTGEDGKNLLIAITAKQLNPASRVVARCHEVRNIEKMRKAGADAIVSPDFTGGLRIASAMIRPNVVNFLDEMLKSEDKLRVEEIIVPAGFPATAVEKLRRGGRDYMLLALRSHGEWAFNPGDSHLVEAGNTLVYMASPAGRHHLEKLLGWS